MKDDGKLKNDHFLLREQNPPGCFQASLGPPSSRGPQRQLFSLQAQEIHTDGGVTPTDQEYEHASRQDAAAILLHHHVM